MKILQKKQQLPHRRTNFTPRDAKASDASFTARYAFRRNRTLTGSLSSDVSSVNEHSSELRSPRVEAHHLRRHRRRLISALAVVMLVAGALAWWIYYAIAGVAIIVTATTSPTDMAQYEQSVQEYLNQAPFERSRITLNTDSLANYMQTHGFPEVKSASVVSTPAGLGASTIQLTMRQPVVQWKTGATQVFVDETGVAFQRNYYAAPGVDVVDETGIPTVDNQVLASDRFLGFIGKIIGQLKVQGYTVTKVTLPENTTRQLRLSLEGIGYPIIASVDRGAGVQAEDAARAVRYLAARGIGAEYVDVRVSGKAYYK